MYHSVFHEFVHEKKPPDGLELNGVEVENEVLASTSAREKAPLSSRKGCEAWNSKCIQMLAM